MKLKDYGYPYWKEGKIRKGKKIGNKRVIILSINGVNNIQREGWKNLLAIDDDENILWIAELPTEVYDCYYDMKFENGIIYAHSSNSFVSEINPETGVIIKKYMVK